MEYDNKRDRNLYGYDAGNILDGEVFYDENRKEYIIKDEDGIGFSVQDLLRELEGKRIRFTCISFESLEEMNSMLAAMDQSNN